MLPFPLPSMLSATFTSVSLVVREILAVRSIGLIPCSWPLCKSYHEGTKYNEQIRDSVESGAERQQEAVILLPGPHRNTQAARQHRIRRHDPNQNPQAVQLVENGFGRHRKLKQEKIRTAGVYVYPRQAGELPPEALLFLQNCVN